MIAPSLDLVLDSLAHLICSDAQDDARIASVHNVSADMFDGFTPLVGDGWILGGNDVSDQPVWPVDLSIAYPIGEELGWPVGSWQFKRYKTLAPREWRGKIHQVFPRMLDIAICTTSPSGEKVSVRLPYALLKDRLLEVPRTNTGTRATSAGAWSIDPSWFGSNKGGGSAEEELAREVRFIGGHALRKWYHWSVLLGEGRGPRARFLTDAIGMREAFRLRDVPPGRARRAALLHWVRSHWRQKRSLSNEDRAWVNAHLRGARSFNWSGLVCQVEPSGEDEAILAGQA